MEYIQEYLINTSTFGYFVSAELCNVNKLINNSSQYFKYINYKSMDF